MTAARQLWPKAALATIEKNDAAATDLGLNWRRDLDKLCQQGSRDSSNSYNALTLRKRPDSKCIALNNVNASTRFSIAMCWATFTAQTEPAKTECVMVENENDAPRALRRQGSVHRLRTSKRPEASREGCSVVG